MKTSIKVNPLEKVRLIFENIADDLIQETIESNFNFYKQCNDNAEFKKMLFDLLFQQFIERSIDNPQSNQ